MMRAWRLTSVWRRLSRTFGRAGRLGWRVLAHRARLGRPGSRPPLCASVAGGGGIYCGCLPALLVYTVTVTVRKVHQSPLATLSDGDTIAVLHTHDGMVSCHAINKPSWILCILYWQCQFNKVDIMSMSTTTFRQKLFLLDLVWGFAESYVNFWHNFASRNIKRLVDRIVRWIGLVLTYTVQH